MLAWHRLAGIIHRPLRRPVHFLLSKNDLAF
jgi:hypothetical protein